MLNYINDRGCYYRVFWHQNKEFNVYWFYDFYWFYEYTEYVF